MSAHLPNSTTIPTHLFERMAHCYYGEGPRYREEVPPSASDIEGELAPLGGQETISVPTMIEGLHNPQFVPRGLAARRSNSRVPEPDNASD